ncbi:hypothetical protein [Sinorhizobium meliloti]|uniref:hypothetical protein n=1 Tax=Rhizobium meliloti TaxID=382 RepID=UPI0003780256|nr:hypothetical protein [Sinorhizobium meliloti]
MKINGRSAAARRRAAELYPGESLPISVVKQSDQPLSLEWWQSNPQAESSGSTRHTAALTLYLEISKASKIPLPKDTFPARLDFDDEMMRPDKGVMKVFLDEGLVTARFMGAQLVFEVTAAGHRYLASTEVKGDQVAVRSSSSP